MSRVERAYIGLGANLGDAVTTLHTVLNELRGCPGVLYCEPSRFYRTAPVDASGPHYMNAVAALDTTLAPLELLDLLQTLETRHGRQRTYPNAPRTLDLDLLWHGDTTLDTVRLTLPHPRMHERAFVLAPLRELVPDLVLRQGGITQLLEGLSGQWVERLD